MATQWHVGNLDPKLLFEVIDNRDPDTSSRFSLPIPNWLDENGEPTFSHKSIKFQEKKGEYRFMFKNYVDGCDQGVKINGDGTIMFMAPTEKQCEQIRNIISNFGVERDQLTPDMIETALDQIYTDTGIIDRWNSSRKDIDQKLDAVYDVEDGYYGRFVYKYGVSSAIFIEGNGMFDGVAASDQSFEDGAFILFPKKSIREATEIIRSYDPQNPGEKVAKKVGQEEFLKTRRMNHGSESLGLPIKLYDIPKQAKPKQKYYKPRPISGFPELTPEYQAVQNNWISTISSTFERYGFTNIETPSVEEIPVLAAKGGDADKEIYAIARLNQDEANNNQPKIALHYDLTVPMSRYIAQHYSSLDFPFKRYQIQKAWRGEKPQNGRFREFYQCDIDVVDQDNLSLEFDAEMPVILYNLINDLNIGNVEINVNNRKILQGFYQGLGLEDEQIVQVIRTVDKIDKIGEDGVSTVLSEDLSLPIELIEKCIALSKIKTNDTSFVEQVLDLGVDTPLLREGLEELSFVMERMEGIPKDLVTANMSIARGFDYYTGTVYEGKFVDYPEYPTILAGGRYSNLVSNYMNKSLPGVGISLGLTRIFSKLMERGLIEPGVKTPTEVLVVHSSEQQRKEARAIADTLRSKGVNTEVYHDLARTKKQLSYADRKGIPYVLFPQEDGQAELKTMSTGDQKPVNLSVWKPEFKK